MPESGKFMDYSGPVDYKIIDGLLGDLKKSKEFIRLNKTAAKRTYSILVECLENIAKHSLRNIPDDIRNQPFIKASDRNDKIVINTGNIIQDDKRIRLIKILEHINPLDHNALVRL